MLVYKISLVDCDEQHWEDEETARRMKKQRAMEVSQLFLSETVLEKEFEELLTLSCNSATGPDAVVVCWGVHSDIANVSTAVT